MKGKRTKKVKENKKIGKKIFIFIIIVLIIAIGWFGYKIHKNGGGLSGMLATVIGHNEYTKKDLNEIKVLLMGVSTDIDAELTDTIIVASYNPNTQKANLLSIPRDTFTGKNQNRALASQKINCLYNISKNPMKTVEAVNEVTGLDIKYYVMVRTEALIKLVDAIGGVDFYVPRDMEYKDESQDLVIDLKEGQQKLDGSKAEQLLRWRHSNYKRGVGMETYSTEYGNDDFGRMRTQRDFIVATLKQTLKPSNIFKIGQILEIANRNVETNLELDFVKDYIPYAVELNTDNIATAVLPGTTPDTRNTNNISIFIADKQETKKLVETMFSNVTTENTSAENNSTENEQNSNSNIKIELINGCKDSTKFERAVQLLKDAGYNVTKTSSKTSTAKTIITNKKDVSNEQLIKIKDILKTGSVSTAKSSTSLVDITIVIGKDFN